MQTAKQIDGHIAFLSGASAEDQIAQIYERNGLGIVNKRWRGHRGEIDLIVRDGDAFVFVEVKKSKSISGAAERLGRSQMRRICACAEEYVADQPQGLNSEMRFDVALLDAKGQFEIIQNAFGWT